MILPSSAASLPVDIPRLGSQARLLRAYGPGLAELLRVLQQPAPPRGKVVLGHGIEVTAEAAQTSLVRGGYRHLEKADAVPEDLDADLRVDDHAVGGAVDV